MWGDAWLHEPKLDGRRLLAVKRGKDVALYSRPGREFTHRFPVIAEAIGRLPCRSVPMDERTKRSRR
jgi:bifunctional non-homologous end joining protein LigD